MTVVSASSRVLKRTPIRRESNDLSLRIVAPLFRAPFLRSVLRDTHRKHLSEVLCAVGVTPTEVANTSLGAVLDGLYRKLAESYRCECVFKNLVTQSLFLDRHSPRDAFLTDEFRAGMSRADVVILNGTSTVYEIKTELDSFIKLPGQLSDYRNVFDRINVVVPTSLEDKAVEVTSEDIGVLVVEDNLCIRESRIARSNKARTSPASIFDCMRSVEYQACLQEALGFVPDVPNGRRYATCRELFLSLEPTLAHDLMVRHVQKRGSRNPASSLIHDAPGCLVHACLTLGESKRATEKLALVLRSPVGVL